MNKFWCLVAFALAKPICDDFDLDISYDGANVVFKTVSPDGSWLGLLLGSSNM